MASHVSAHAISMEPAGSMCIKNYNTYFIGEALLKWLTCRAQIS